MGITRARDHKRKATGGSKKGWRSKRKHSMGRQPAMTKLGEKRIQSVRVRGGNIKNRALRLEFGNFAWGTESCTRKSRILNVVYNAAGGELVRTNILTKGAIVLIDASPFKQWYKEFYGLDILSIDKKEDVKVEEKKDVKVEEKAPEKTKPVAKKFIERRTSRQPLPENVVEQFKTGRLMASVSSRPGQCGRCDGYIIEGPEYEFYSRKLSAKKKKNSGQEEKKTRGQRVI